MGDFDNVTQEPETEAQRRSREAAAAANAAALAARPPTAADYNLNSAQGTQPGYTAPRTPQPGDADYPAWAAAHGLRQVSTGEWVPTTGVWDIGGTAVNTGTGTLAANSTPSVPVVPGQFTATDAAVNAPTTRRHTVMADDPGFVGLSTAAISPAEEPAYLAWAADADAGGAGYSLQLEDPNIPETWKQRYQDEGRDQLGAVNFANGARARNPELKGFEFADPSVVGATAQNIDTMLGETGGDIVGTPVLDAVEGVAGPLIGGSGGWTDALSSLMSGSGGSGGSGASTIALSPIDPNAFNFAGGTAPAVAGGLQSTADYYNAQAAGAQGRTTPAADYSAMAPGTSAWDRGSNEFRDRGGVLDAARQNEDYLRRVSMGEAGPSAAEIQMTKGNEEAVRQQMAMAAGARGWDAAGTARAVQAGQELQLRGQQDAAQLRAQEQLQARQLLLQQQGQRAGYGTALGQLGTTEQQIQAQTAQFDAQRAQEQQKINDAYEMGMAAQAAGRTEEARQWFLSAQQAAQALEELRVKQISDFNAAQAGIYNADADRAAAREGAELSMWGTGIAALADMYGAG